jgi:iron complex outermembrane recepter protein
MPLVNRAWGDVSTTEGNQKMNLRGAFLLALLSSAATSPAYAQQGPTPPGTSPVESGPDQEVIFEEELEEGTIVVVGQRLRGQVDTDIPPEVQLNEEEIRALGAGSIAELIEALAPQTRSNRGRGGGRPVMLINGRRISGFSEIRDLPPEAIERIDIMPEEVALRYGYPADQRVVNLVLKENFRAFTTETEYGVATAGGRDRYRANAGVLRIAGPGRWSFNAEYLREDPLFESERDIVQADSVWPYAIGGNITGVGGGEIDPALSALAGYPLTVAGVPASAASGAPSLEDFMGRANEPYVTGLGAYRTLLGSNDQLSFSGTVNRMLSESISATLHARVTGTDTQSRFGLPSVTLLVPENNPYSPFGRDVRLYRYEDGFSALSRQSTSQAGHLGLALNGNIRPWRWSFTANYDRSGSLSRTDTGFDAGALQDLVTAGDPNLNPFSPLGPGILLPRAADRARTVSETAAAEAVASGPIVNLPAGPLNATMKLGADSRGIESWSVRSMVEEERALSRQRGNAQASLDVPIASRREGVLEAIGNLSLNLNAAVEHLSDFGTLRTYGYGFNWSPIEAVRLIASVTDEDSAPSMQQLGDPTVVAPNARVFDLVRGETVDISRIDGGNPDLLADNRRVMRLGVNIRPFGRDLSLNANYTNSRTLNLISSFPGVTPEIEAAFPERFLRDASGRLVQIDNRPVNFARADQEALRWGINFSAPFGSAPEAPQRQGRWGGVRPAAAPASGGDGEAPAPRPGRGEGPRREGQAASAEGQAAPAEGAPPQRVERPAQAGSRGPGGGGGMMRGMFGGGPQRGRIQLSLYHNWRFQDTILIREGVPELDLLDGSSTGGRGGRPRHELELQAGVFKSGLGARLTGNWQSGTFVRGGPDGLGGTRGDLNFSDLTTFNLQFFANLGERRALVERVPFLANSRVTLAVDNLFDSRMRVTDDLGQVPLGYQPHYLDPLGRAVRISFRKQFF